MNTEENILYIKDNTGSLREWAIRVEDDEIIIRFGAVGGAMQEKSECVTEGLSGRTLNEQIMSRVASRMGKQRDKGYVTSMQLAANRKAVNALGLKKPMLAQRFDKVANVDLIHSHIQMKYNGHRCLVTCVNGENVAYSRNGKLIESIGHILVDLELEEGMTIDGELYCHGIALQTISSFVKRPQSGTINLKYMVYDIISDKPYIQRLKQLRSLNIINFSEVVPTKNTVTIKSIKQELIDAINKGYEGLIIRQGSQGYEDGKRSKSLVKIKKCFDDEFKVIDIVESVDGWARLKCLIGSGHEDLKSGEVFSVSAPGTMKDKYNIMHNKDNYIGQFINIEYFEVTAGGIPFHPVATYFIDDI